MCRAADFDPFTESWRFFSRFMYGGPSWRGRCFYTRKERIERLERLKQILQDEISGIDELIQDLRRREPEEA